MPAPTRTRARRLTTRALRMREGAPAPLVAGNQALARGEWALARTGFSRALQDGETPEALEGLAMAAWWLSDVATVFDARARAYRLYSRRRDRRGAGRVAVAVAGDYLHFRCQVAVARGWLRRAYRLLDGLGAIPERAWLLIWDGDLGLLAGEEPSRVRELVREAGAIGRSLGNLNIEMPALALEGLSLVMAGRLAEGMACLDEATAAAVSGDLTHPLSIGLSCCYLIMACELIRDFPRADEWCGRVRELCARTGFDFLLVTCRTQYAGVLIWRGAWVEAEAELDSVPASRPALQQDASLRLADLRRLQGRLDEASVLLARVGDGHPLALLGRAALALDRSAPTDAAHLAERFLRRLPSSSRIERVAALDLLLRAQLARGERARARVALAELQAIAVGIGTEPARVTALLGAGLVAAAEGAHGEALVALEGADDLLTRTGSPLELASCRLELGRVMAAMGQREGAERAVSGALDAFERLGARLLAQSASAVLRGLRGAPAAPARQDGLTRREVEVLHLLAGGLTNARIARSLGVSEFTVKRHVANLLGKLELPTRAAAAAYATRAGLS